MNDYIKPLIPLNGHEKISKKKKKVICMTSIMKHALCDIFVENRSYASTSQSSPPDLDHDDICSFQQRH